MLLSTVRLKIYKNLVFSSQEEWSVFLATKRRVTKLKMTEYEHAFEEETKEDLKVTVSTTSLLLLSLLLVK